MTTSVNTRAVDLASLGTALTLAVHTGHLPLWLTLALAAVLVLRWQQVRRGSGATPVWLKLPLVALLLAAVLLHYGSIFGRAPGSALAVGLLVLKLLETNAARDIRSTVAFGCFVLMSALLFDQGMSFTALVTLALIPYLAALRALQPRAFTPAWHRELAPVASQLLLVVPLALFAFLFVPRLATPLWGAPNLEAGVTGLSDSMSPGNLTQLLIDDSPAMRVTFQGPPPARRQRYFRAWVMTHFDGRTWSRVDVPRRPPAPLQVAEAIRYSIQLEPTRGHVLPTLDVPIKVHGALQMSAAHEVFTRAPLDAGYHYQLRSATRYRLQPVLSHRVRQRNLALPAGFDPRARQLAARWRQRYHGDAAAIAAAAMTYFHNRGFTYTLNPPPLGRDSIDDFLFATKQGFCQHYSSAFTFLMRAAGVPARVVTGYQGGYWNQSGQYLLVHKSDAHAWSEIWINERGWVRFDPTAMVSPEQIGTVAGTASGSSWYQAAWIRDLRNRWDIVNRGWNQAVVAFDHARQQGMLTPFGIDHTRMRTLTLILAIGCSLALALAAYLTLRQRRPRDPLLAIQRRLEKKLARAGLARRANEGPRDFMQRATLAFPEHAGQLRRVYKRYIHLRYARTAPSAREIAEYRTLVAESIRRKGV